jgi:hypothetical protein
MEGFKRTFSTTSSFLFLLVAGCAPVVPHLLTDARVAYRHASASRAADLSPAQLLKAEVALTKAEQSWAADHDP